VVDVVVEHNYGEEGGRVEGGGEGKKGASCWAASWWWARGPRSRTLRPSRRSSAEQLTTGLSCVSTPNDT